MTYTRTLNVATDDEAVRVEKHDDGTESVLYHADKMIQGVVYEIIWNGVPYGIKKNKKSVSFMRFVPD